MGGANEPLTDSQRQFTTSPDSDPQLIERRNGALARDPLWHPLGADDEFETPTPGVDYGMTYPEDTTALYYWRASPVGNEHDSGNGGRSTG